MLAVGYWDRSAWPTQPEGRAAAPFGRAAPAGFKSTRRAACAPPRPRPTAAGAPEPTTAGHGSAVYGTHSVRSHAVCDSIQLRLASIRHGCAICVGEQARAAVPRAEVAVQRQLTTLALAAGEKLRHQLLHSESTLALELSSSTDSKTQSLR
jgi:hypothetical protein